MPPVPGKCPPFTKTFLLNATTQCKLVKRNSITEPQYVILEDQFSHDIKYRQSANVSDNFSKFGTPGCADPYYTE